MSASGVTLRGRAAAEALMVDACTVTRGTPTTELDPVTGEYSMTAGGAVYTGRCRVKPKGSDGVVDAGGQAVSLLPYVVSVPVTTTAYAVDDVVTVTASALDPALVGTVLRVRHVATGSHLTARRLGCEVDAG